MGGSITGVTVGSSKSFDCGTGNTCSVRGLQKDGKTFAVVQQKIGSGPTVVQEFHVPAGNKKTAEQNLALSGFQGITKSEGGNTYSGIGAHIAGDSRGLKKYVAFNIADHTVISRSEPGRADSTTLYSVSTGKSVAKTAQEAVYNFGQTVLGLFKKA